MNAVRQSNPPDTHLPAQGPRPDCQFLDPRASLTNAASTAKLAVKAVHFAAGTCGEPRQCNMRRTVQTVEQWEYTADGMLSGTTTTKSWPDASLALRGDHLSLLEKLQPSDKSRRQGAGAVDIGLVGLAWVCDG